MVELEEVSVVEIEPPTPAAICIKIGAGCMGCFFADQCPRVPTEESVLELCDPIHDGPYSFDQPLDDVIVRIEASADTREAAIKLPVAISPDMSSSMQTETLHVYDYMRELEDDSIPVVVARHAQTTVQAAPTDRTERKQSEVLHVRNESPTDVSPGTYELLTKTDDRPPVEQATQTVMDIIDIRATNKEQSNELPKQTLDIKGFSIIGSDTEVMQHETSIGGVPQIITVVTKPTVPHTIQSIPQRSVKAKAVAGSEYESDVVPRIYTFVEINSQEEPTERDLRIATERSVAIEEDMPSREDAAPRENSNDKHDILRRYLVGEEMVSGSAILEGRSILSGIDELIDPENDDKTKFTYSVSYKTLLQHIATLALSSCSSP